MNFIDLKTAAERSGKSEGHLRRICGDKWMGEGLARLEQPTDGKSRSTWFVSEDADPSFALVKFAEQLTKEFDMRTVSAKARNKANDRLRIVQAWHADLAAGRQLNLSEKKVTEQFIDRMLIEENRTISRPTLYNWARASRDGIAGLLNVYGDGGSKVPAVAAPDPFLEAVKNFWLRQTRPPLKTCYDYAAKQARIEGWPICSFKTIERRIKALPEQLVIKKRLGDTAFANQVLPPARRDYSSIDTNSWWCSDHHQFDVIVSITGPDGKPKLVRPWVTCWQDLRSRKIVGWHIFGHDPNQSTILMSLRAGCLAEGVPQIAYIDNGKDYDSYTLQGITKAERQKTMTGKMAWVRRKIKVEVDGPAVGGVMGALGVKVVHAIAYNAKAKPVERFFNTLCSRFSKFHPTYCGRNPQEKPENLPDQLSRGNAPAIEDFADQFAVWLDGDYHQNVHEGDSMDGLCPADAFNKFLVNRRVARLEDLQLLIQKTSKPLVAGREGVVWGGIRYGAGDPALFPYFRQKVYLRVDPQDVTVAAVYTVDDVWIADVRANIDLAYGASEEEFRRAAKDRKAVTELTNSYHNLGPRMHASITELIEMNRADQQQKLLPGPGDPPPTLTPVRTPLEGQSIPLRKAAGGEGMSPRAPHEAKPKLIEMLMAAEDFDFPTSKAGGGLKLYEDGGE